jgi:hypothetical protein
MEPAFYQAEHQHDNVVGGGVVLVRSKTSGGIGRRVVHKSESPMDNSPRPVVRGLDVGAQK